ncbi:hypothetical protein [Bifidobacterium myosotis]|uniref:Uncharacterized protein n=1 Tax=Bifidobacterium myosotis TaxID=1630166 RepID=A0A5M9ZG79_9BIFI|nr:hypothetical protein [Bifidobacterium myosotis]KAA8825111.1 hypothetical protein EMO91_12850 [Bifidobacterium myosotis]
MTMPIIARDFMEAITSSDSPTARERFTLPVAERFRTALDSGSDMHWTDDDSILLAADPALADALILIALDGTLTARRVRTLAVHPLGRAARGLAAAIVDDSMNNPHAAYDPDRLRQARAILAIPLASRHRPARAAAALDTAFLDLYLGEADKAAAHAALTLRLRPGATVARTVLDSARRGVLPDRAARLAAAA